MKKLYIIVPIVILICIGGKIGQRYYEKYKEYEKTMIEANNAMKSKDYQAVINTLMYAKSLKNESKEIEELEKKATLELKNIENIERAKVLVEEDRHKEAMHILKNIEDSDEASKLLAKVEKDYNKKLAREEKKKQDEILSRNFAELPREELQKSRDTINKDVFDAACKYMKDSKFDIEDIESIRTTSISLYNINGFKQEGGIELGGHTTLSSILDKKWGDIGEIGIPSSGMIDTTYIPISINYNDTVGNTLKILIDNLDSANKQRLEDEYNSRMIDSNFLFSLEISNDENSSENVKNMVKNIRKGVDELVDQEIKRLQEISNGPLDYDKLKYELHPGTHNDIQIEFTKDRMNENQAIVGIRFISSKYGSEPIRHKFVVNSKEVVDILKTVEVHQY